MSAKMSCKDTQNFSVTLHVSDSCSVVDCVVVCDSCLDNPQLPCERGPARGETAKNTSVSIRLLLFARKYSGSAGGMRAGEVAVTPSSGVHRVSLLPCGHREPPVRTLFSLQQVPPHIPGTER